MGATTVQRSGIRGALGDLVGALTPLSVRNLKAEMPTLLLYALTAIVSIYLPRKGPD